MSLLIDRLGYSFSNVIDLEFELLNEAVWYQFIYTRDVDSHLISQVETYRESKLLSNYSTDIYLLNMLGNLYTDNSRSLAPLNELQLTAIQKQHYDILVHHNVNYSTHYQASNDEIGLVSLYKATRLFSKGHYYDAINLAKISFNIFSMNGNILGMIDSSFVESNAYSNLDNIKAHEEMSQRILNLNETVREDEVYFNVYYNLGSSYTVKGEYRKAKENLLKCLDYSNNLNFNHISLYEKLLIVFMFERDLLNFNNYLPQVKSNKTIYDFFYAVKSYNFDFKHSSVIPCLEDCYTTEGANHHGRKLLYGSLLYQAYRANYQYPKALKLLESLNLINPLFFKKKNDITPRFSQFEPYI